MNAFGIGLPHVIKFLGCGLKNAEFVKNVSATEQSNNMFSAPLTSFVKRLPSIVKRRARLIFSVLPHKKTSNVWAIQKGYDVEVLRKIHTSVEFQYVYPREVSEAESTQYSVKLDCLSLLLESSRKYFEIWLPNYTRLLLELVESYANDILSRINLIEQNIKSRMVDERPIAILYALGATTILEHVIGRVANDLRIPVYFFKHGGVENLFLNPCVLDKYLEHNHRVKRTQFVHSCVEKPFFNLMSDVKTVVAGPLERPPAFNVSRSAAKHKILYSVGPPAHWTYKDMRKMTTDSERFYFVKKLLSVVDDLSLSLDIKVHPSEWNVAYQFFKLLLKSKRKANRRVKLLAGGSIERIYKNYGLVVLDIISTRVLSGLFYMDMPIVLFVPSGININPDTFLDLQQRVHIVRCEIDLQSVLQKYARGELPVLKCKEFLDKYTPYRSFDQSLKIVESILFE